jgi:hypothetical protein
MKRYVIRLKKAQNTLEYWKKKLLSILESPMQKAKSYPVGTIREWGGKKYKKLSSGKWVRTYGESQSRGAQQAIRNVQKKIQNATSMEELAQIVSSNMSRFKDENGKTLPVVKEFLAAARGTAPGKKEVKKKEPEIREDLKGLPVTKETLEVKSVGRKWIKVTYPGKSFTMDLEITDQTKSYKPGDTISISAVKKVSSNKYGSKVNIYPVSVDVETQYKSENNKKEIDKWMGYIRDAKEKGYVYEKGVDKIKELGGLENEEIKAEIDGIKKTVSALKRREKIKQYMEYLRNSSDSGYLNKNARDKLIQFGVKDSDFADEFADIIKKTEAHESKKRIAKNQKVLYPSSNPPVLNTPVKRGGSVVVFTGSGTQFKINENHPSIYGTHLLGHEGDTGAYYYYRQATDEEVKEYEKKNEEISKLQKEREKKLATKDSLQKLILSSGEIPGGTTIVEGEDVINTFNIYGGGERIVRDNGYVWYIKNNGMDGDDWSRNNVSTGGAGAIGWRMRETPEIKDMLNAISDMQKSKVIISSGKLFIKSVPKFRRK